MSREVIHAKNFAPDAAAVHSGSRPRLRWRNAANFASRFPAEIRRGRFTEFARIARDLPWERFHFTFGDERCVPPDDRAEQFPDGA